MALRVNSNLTSVASTPCIKETERLLDVVDLILPDGSNYTGQVSSETQLKHGHGTQTWTDGARYTGNWKQGQACGYGIFYHVNGDTFEGNFENDKANGIGTYRHQSG